MFGGSVPSGKKKQAKPTTEGNAVRRFGRNAGDIAQTLHRLPGALTQEVGDIGAYYFGVGSEKREADADRRIRQRGGDPNPKPTKDLGKIARMTAAAPGASFIPGLNTLAGLTSKEGREQLGANPLMTVLDVLPYASKISKTVTAGTKTAAATEQALRQAGKVKKADRIAGVGPSGRAVAPGLNVRQGIGAGIRHLEDKWVQDPAKSGLKPSTWPTRVGFGQQTRTASRLQAGAEATYAKGVDDIIRGVDEAASGAGDDLLRKADLGAPGWKDTLTPDESRFLDDVRTTQAQQVATDPNLAKRLATYGDEIYDASVRVTLDGKSRKLASVVKAIQTTEDKLASGRFSPAKAAQAQGYVTKLRKAADSAVAAQPPVRFMTAITERAVDDVLRALPDLPPEQVKWVREGFFEKVPGALKAWRKAIPARKAEWRALKEAGYDPEFVHRVGRDAARTLETPRITGPRVIAESITKQRSWRPTEYAQDLRVSVSHAKAEALRTQVVTKLIDDMAEAGVLRHADEIEQVLTPAAEAMSKVKGITQGEALKQLTEASYDSIDTAGFIGSPGYKRLGRTQSTFLVPKGMGRAFRQMANPDLNPLVKGIAKSHRALSWAVLYSNPMYYVGQAVSDAYMVMENNGPKAFRQFRKTWKALRDDTLPPEIARGAVTSVDSATADAIHQYRAGVTVQRWLGDGPGTTRDKATRASNAVKKFAGLFDDMAQGMAYFEGVAQAAKKGGSEAAQKAAGLDAAMRTLGVMEELTPVERTTMKVIGPYYAWSRFVVSHALNMPFDHPVRVAVLSSIARVELADWDSDLPLKFRGMLFLGEPNADGTVKAVSMSNFNPYNTLGSYFTLAGLTGRMNPAIQAFFAQKGWGVDGPGLDLFPDIRMNPETGREEYLPPSLGRDLVSNYVPQAGAALDLFMPTEDLKRLKAENPDAYARRIRGNLGPLLGTLPIGGDWDPSLGTVKEYNPQDERSKMGKAAGRIERNRRAKGGSAPKVGGGLFG